MGLQISFNKLVVDYPLVEKFRKEVHEGAITRDIIVKMSESLPILQDETKNLRSFAKKFKQIVVGIEADNDKQLIAEKVTELVKKFQTTKISYPPIVQEFKPFLEKLSCVLTYHGVQLQEAAALNLKNPAIFLNIIDRLNALHLLDAADLRRLNNSTHAERVLEDLIMRKWKDKLSKTAEFLTLRENKNKKNDLDKYREDLNGLATLYNEHYQNLDASRRLVIELKDDLQALAALFATSDNNVKNSIWIRVRPQQFLKATPSRLPAFLSYLKDLSSILGFDIHELLYHYLSEGKVIYECRDLPQVLGVIFPKAREEQKVVIWEQFVRCFENEIEFLSYSEASTADFLYRPDPYNKVSPMQDLLIKYKDNPKELAVIYRLANEKDRKYIWKRLIVRNKKEIEFLSQVDLPGAIDAESFREIIRPQTKWINALVKRSGYDLVTIAAISKLLTNLEQRTEFWDKVIVPNKLEVNFLHNLTPALFSSFREVLNQDIELW